MASFNIGTRKTGEASPVFIVAEIGANHNGDLALARKLVEAAADAGVDAVKFQTYRAADLVADGERIVTWGPPGNQRAEPVGRMFDRLSLPFEAHKDLFDLARRLGLVAFSTPFSLEAARFLADLAVPCFKIASSDVTYLDLLRAVAAFNKPVLLSTGKSTLGEVDRAVTTLAQAGCKEIGLLHCVGKYPAPLEDTNLRVISTLSAIYPNAIIGYSDHSQGTTACLGAVTLGAKVVEKHFTLSCDSEGPDHWFSADPEEMKRLVKEIRALESALGMPWKRVLPCEEQGRNLATRSLVLAKSVRAGTAITESHLKVLRPGWGIHPHDKEKVVGLKVNQDLPAGTVLKWEHFR